MNKRSEGEASVPRRSSASATPSSEIDVVNLSSQLISMELLSSSSQCFEQQTSSSKSRKRKQTQKVRFDLPDDLEEKKPKVSGRRRKSPSPRRKSPSPKRRSPSPHKGMRKKKMPVRRWNYSKLSWKSVPCPSTSTQLDFVRVDKSHFEVNGNSVDNAKEDHVLTVGEANDDSKVEVSSDAVRLVMDKNNNCSSPSYHRLCQKDKSVRLRKSKSDSSAISKKSKVVKKAKKLKVVSKKFKVKTDKLQKGVKRKYSFDPYGDSNAKHSNTKRRRISEKSSKQKQKLSYKRSPEKRSKAQQNTCKKGVSVTRRSKSKAYKSKSLTPKMKQAKAKLQKAKKTKQAALQKKLKQQINKAAKKKSMLKKQYKKMSLKSSLGKNKRKDERVICSCHGYKKLRISPIERNDDYDVIPALRVTFLKYLTFKEAHNRKYECCQKYCWDRWDEPDMYDIIDDYE